MHAGADRQGGARPSRGRGLAASFAVVVALAAAGCGSTAGGNGSNVVSGNGTVPLVTGEQVVTACFHSYFYNGILPKAAAQANCRSCVVQRLRKLGIQPAAGENVIDMLTGDRLSAADIQSLQNSCNEQDASSQ